MSSLPAPAPPVLPEEVTARLLADLDRIARQMTRQIADAVSLSGPFRTVGYLRSLFGACRDALGTLLRLLHDGRGLRAGDLDRLGVMGAQQAELGLPIEVMLSAYRLAAKVVLEEVSRALAESETQLSPAEVFGVAETVLSYLDDISGAVGATYLATRERRVRERDRERDRLLQRLLAGDSTPDVLRGLVATGLELAPPYHVVAVALAEPDAATAREVETELRSAAAAVIVEGPSQWLCLLDGRLTPQAIWRRCHHAAPSARIDVGGGAQAETFADIGEAARRARSSLQIGRRVQPERNVHDDAETGAFAALAADPEAMRRFAEAMLGRLAHPTTTRDRQLLATLEVLLTGANLSEAAQILGIHRHTVVYRLGRLRALGVDPEAPGAGHRLWLALLGLRITGPGAEPGAAASRS